MPDVVAICLKALNNGYAIFRISTFVGSVIPFRRPKISRMNHPNDKALAVAHFPEIRS
ncbi:MAG: hypothetical protein RIK87_14720 [Fuerstiella sp.]